MKEVIVKNRKRYRANIEEIVKVIPNWYEDKTKEDVAEVYIYSEKFRGLRKEYPLIVTYTGNTPSTLEFWKSGGMSIMTMEFDGQGNTSTYASWDYSDGQSNPWVDC